MIKTIAEAEALLRTYIPAQRPTHYTLGTMRALLAFLGDPQETLRIVHIAGTSGKTSTAYFVRALAQAGGARTGLAVSPHMESITERVQINGVPLTDAAFLTHFNRFVLLLQKSGLRPSYFEILIAFAFWVFAHEKVDLAIIETGLGGLLDATNTVRRDDKLCVITDIGLDHTEILGETLPKIAAQKAGIIQPGNMVIVLDQPPAALDVIKKIATHKKATLRVATPATHTLPPFQRRNLGVALATYAALGLPALTPEQLRQAAAQTPPGRLEVYKIGKKTVIVDGAHNAQKLQALNQALSDRGITKTTVMCNMVAAPQAKIEAAITELLRFASRVIVPEFTIAQDFNGRSALPAADFSEQITRLGTPAQPIPNPADALTALLQSPEDTVVIAGSLYLAQTLRPLLRDLA